MDLPTIPYFTTAETETPPKSTDFYITESSNSLCAVPSSRDEDHAGHVPR